MVQPTEDDLLMDLIKTNKETDGKTMTRKQYEKNGDYNPWQAVNRFGSWREARASAGVYAEHDTSRITDNEILEDIKDKAVDGEITAREYRDKGEYSASTVYNRFDSFESARSKALKK